MKSLFPWRIGVEKIQRDSLALRWPTGGPKLEFSLSAEVQMWMSSASKPQDLGDKVPGPRGSCLRTTLDGVAFTSWLPTWPRIGNPLLKSSWFLIHSCSLRSLIQRRHWALSAFLVSPPMGNTSSKFPFGFWFFFSNSNAFLDVFLLLFTTPVIQKGYDATLFYPRATLLTAFHKPEGCTRNPTERAGQPQATSCCTSHPSSARRALRLWLLKRASSIHCQSPILPYHPRGFPTHSWACGSPVIRKVGSKKSGFWRNANTFLPSLPPKSTTHHLVIPLNQPKSIFNVHKLLLARLSLHRLVSSGTNRLSPARSMTPMGCLSCCIILLPLP